MVPSVTTTSAPATTSTYVVAPTQTVAGTTPYCYEWYTISSGGTFYAIEREYGITMAELVALNTAIKADYSNLELNVACCFSGVPLGSSSSVVSTTTTISTKTNITSAAPVTTPSPIQTGMASGCNVFYEAQSGDGCYDIAADYGISLDDFHAWNPAVGDKCAGLWPTYYYCVSM